MTAAPRKPLNLTSDQFDYLADVLHYYRASDYGGGDRDNTDDRLLHRDMELRVLQRREQFAAIHSPLGDCGKPAHPPWPHDCKVADYVACRYAPDDA